MTEIGNNTSGENVTPPSPPPEIKIVAPDIARLTFSNTSFPPSSKNWPAFHLTSPWGWINDPCGPGYDPATKTYHLFYQWNAKGCEWGNMSWGHMTSKDLLRWWRNGTEPVIQASRHTGEDHDYDREAVFTGCMVPTGPLGEENQLTAIYTSISELPFHWSEPYPRGAAGLAAAVSEDGGQTWDKHPDNPFVVEEPPKIKVTGFRDPYVDNWPHIDELLEEPPNSSKYGVMSGGIADECATVFLYQISPNNLLEWKYLGSLIKAQIGFRPSQKWTGDSGVNWECANFMTLTSHTGASRDILVMGTEGGQDRDHVLPTSASISVSAPVKENGQAVPQRVSRWTLWMSAVARNSSTPEHRLIEMDYKFGGIFDHGAAYAPNSFEDPTTGKRLVWSWLIEEDVPIEFCEDKGWTGCITLPRELFLFEIDNITSGFKSTIEELACTFESEPSTKDDGHTIRTLGIRPLKGLQDLRRGAPSVHVDRLCKLALPLDETLTSQDDPSTSTDIPVPGTRWEITAAVKVHDHCSTVGLRILHGPGTLGATEITFHPQKEEIVVKRPRPQSENSWPVNDREERGPHTLFRYAEGGIEKLKLRIFRDGQVLEVYANDRWAMATMIYTDIEEELAAEEEALVSVFATCGDGKEDSGRPAAVFEDIKVFEMVGGIVSTLG